VIDQNRSVMTLLVTWDLGLLDRGCGYSRSPSIATVGNPAMMRYLEYQQKPNRTGSGRAKKDHEGLGNFRLSVHLISSVLTVCTYILYGWFQSPSMWFYIIRSSKPSMTSLRGVDGLRETGR
jgi:hypothetical protein